MRNYNLLDDDTAEDAYTFLEYDELTISEYLDRIDRARDMQLELNRYKI